MRYKISSLLDLNGNPLTITVIHPRKSVFVLSVHKAGSVLINKIVESIAITAKLPYCDFAPQIFSQGISESLVSTEMLNVLENHGVVYLGFRSLGNLDRVTNFRVAKKMLLIRDPRDIAVSFYFSLKKSHWVPPSGDARSEVLEMRERFLTQTIDEYVLSGGADGPLWSLKEYMEYQIRSGDIKLFKYEDVIYQKRTWVAELCEFMSVRLLPEEINAIADANDVIPSEERENEHVRQVHPGNYLKHLSRESISCLETRFREVFEFYGYQCGDSE